MLLGSGSIRNPEIGPIVLFNDLAECFPYDDPVYMIRVTGKQFKEMIRFMLRDEVWAGSHCEFYQFSEGLRVVYDKATHDFKEFLFESSPIDDNRRYKVGMQKFHYKSIEDFLNISMDEILKNGKPRMLSTSCREILDEYLSSHQHLDSSVRGRIIVE